jgi:hypothetical protein
MRRGKKLDCQRGANMREAIDELPVSQEPADGASDKTSAVVGELYWRCFGPKPFAAGLAVLTLLQFSDVLLRARTFVFRDFGLFGYPLAHYYREALFQGQFPLWNPLSNCGLPFLAQWNTMVLYPPCLFYLLFPLPWAVSTLCIVHLYLAGLGMYFLTFRWTRHRLAATVAAVAFAFNGMTLNCLMWPNNIAALGWMPWVVLLGEKGWQRGGRGMWMAAVVGALQMLTGAPEIILFTWLVLGALGLGQWLTNESGRARSLLRFAVIVALVASLTSAQLLPFLEMLRHSQRDQGYSTAQWPMPAWGWANFLVPLFRSYRSLPGVFFQYEQGWTTSYYLGAGVLALALLAAVHVRNSRVRLLALVCVLSMVVALGVDGYLFGWLRRVVPILGFMRYPIKFVVLAAFSVPLLAAFGVRAWLQGEPGERRIGLRSVCLTWAGLLMIIGFILWFAHGYPYKEEIWGVTLSSGLRSGLWLTLILGSLFLLRRPPLPRQQLIAGLGLVVFVYSDGVSHTARQNPTADASLFEPALPPLRELEPLPTPGESRIMLNLDAMTQYHHTLLSDPGKNFLCHRLGAFCNANLLDRLPKVDGFWSLYLRRERDIHFNLYLSTNQIRPRLADFLGVCQVTADDKPFEWAARTSSLPLVTAGQRPVFVEGAESLRGVLASDFDPRQEVYLPTEAAGQIQVTNRTAARVLSSRFRAHLLTIEVSAPETSLVVLAQCFYPAWKAYVDGVPVRLWRANHAFQAVQVPPGTHQVTLRYEDRAFQTGMVISVVALLACAMGWRRWRAAV